MGRSRIQSRKGCLKLATHSAVSCQLELSQATLSGPSHWFTRPSFADHKFELAENPGEIVLWGPKWLHAHFYSLGINFPITQDICYTRLSARNYLVYFGAFIRCSLWICQLHTLIVWELIFQLHTSVTPKNRFRIICGIISGLIGLSPPPPAISGSKAFSGGVYFEAPRGRNFIRPPPPEGYFQGGGVGVYKIRPRRKCRSPSCTSPWTILVSRVRKRGSFRQGAFSEHALLIHWGIYYLKITLTLTPLNCSGFNFRV